MASKSWSTLPQRRIQLLVLRDCPLKVTRFVMKTNSGQFRIVELR